LIRLVREHQGDQTLVHHGHAFAADVLGGLQDLPFAEVQVLFAEK